MDNPGSRKTDAVRAAIRGAGARLLFLPPCSPDPDPIEQAFAKLKHLLRKDQPRSRDDLWKMSAPSWKSSRPKNARTTSPTRDAQWVKLSEKRSNCTTNKKILRSSEYAQAKIRTEFLKRAHSEISFLLQPRIVLVSA